MEPLNQFEVLSALNIVVLAPARDSSITILGDSPVWLQRILPEASHTRENLALDEASPFLANFLIDAAEFWQTSAPSLHSGPWTQRDIDGNECSLSAWAVNAAGRKLILLRLLGEEFEESRAVIQAVRDAKLSNEQLDRRNRTVERFNRLKSEFLASVSHELRAPLNAIIGFSTLLSEDSTGPLNTDQRDFVTHVLRASNHLLALMNDILDLSKIEADRLELNPETFVLADALAEVLSTLRPIASAKHIDIEIRGALQSRIYADCVRFRQILYNLLSNALKFTPADGHVAVEASVECGWLSVTVTDDGPGIPEAEREAIFERFYQVGTTPKRVQEGTGLGLAITKRLVEQHGGRIHVEAPAGGGGRFVFSLPHAEEDEGPADASGSEEASVRFFASGPPDLLVALVDDDAASRSLFPAMLQPFYRVATYADSGEALSAFARERPDVVMFDDIESLQRMKADPRLREIGAIAVSSHAMTGDRERFLAAGFDDYIAKPVSDRQTLLNAIARVHKLQ
jgi:signal transduction histidine kinase